MCGFNPCRETESYLAKIKLGSKGSSFFIPLLRVERSRHDVIVSHVSDRVTPLPTTFFAFDRDCRLNHVERMKKILLAAVVAAFFVSTAADARGGRGFSGGRSFSRPAPTKSYAPKRTTVVKKNTTVINQTVNSSATSSGGGFWSSVMGSAVGSTAGSMAGNAIYDSMTKDDEPKQPAQAPQQPQVIYVPVGSDGKPVQQAQ